MKFAKYVVVLTSFGLCLYHSYAWRYYDHVVDQSRASGFPSDGLWETQLILIHMALSALFFITATSTLLGWRFAKYTVALSGIGVAAIYTWWYLERYSYLKIVYEVDSNSVDAHSRLTEIGFFLGATHLDYIAFGITLILLPAVLMWSFSQKKSKSA